MYSSNQHDYDKFSSSPAPSAPAPYTQHMPATGIPANSTGQYNQYGNFQPPQQEVVQPREEVPWSTGICDCGKNLSNCCITCFCPCITYGLVSEAVDRGSTSCLVHGTIYALLNFLTGCGCLLSGCKRSSMRRQLMLSESPCGDCLVHCCCESCALCQEYRELQNRKFNMSLGNAERQNGGVSMAPVVQGGMSR